MNKTFIRYITEKGNKLLSVIRGDKIQMIGFEFRYL